MFGGGGGAGCKGRVHLLWAGATAGLAGGPAPAKDCWLHLGGALYPLGCCGGGPGGGGYRMACGCGVWHTGSYLCRGGSFLGIRACAGGTGGSSNMGPILGDSPWICSHR